MEGKGTGAIPRLNQCYLCRAWQLEKSLFPVEVPDQVGYVQKLACQECLDKILPKGRGDVENELSGIGKRKGLLSGSS